MEETWKQERKGWSLNDTKNTQGNDKEYWWHRGVNINLEHIQVIAKLKMKEHKDRKKRKIKVSLKIMK